MTSLCRCFCGDNSSPLRRFSAAKSHGGGGISVMPQRAVETHRNCTGYFNWLLKYLLTCWWIVKKNCVSPLQYQYPPLITSILASSSLDPPSPLHLPEQGIKSPALQKLNFTGPGYILCCVSCRNLMVYLILLVAFFPNSLALLHESKYSRYNRAPKKAINRLPIPKKAYLHSLVVCLELCFTSQIIRSVCYDDTEGGISSKPRLHHVCLLLVSCMVVRQFARLVEFHQADDTTAGMDQSVLFALGRNTKKQHPHPLSERNENITEADLLNRCCIWTVKSDEAVKQRTYASYASGLC
jgi:hypothetical protein